MRVYAARRSYGGSTGGNNWSRSSWPPGRAGDDTFYWSCWIDWIVNDAKEMPTYFMRCRGLKRLEGEHNTIRLQTNSQASLQIDD